MSTTQNEEKKCVWACNDGYFLLEPNENRISQPMAIVLGAVGGVLLGLICKYCSKVVVKVILENRISQPMAIVLGAVGGVFLGLICM